MRKAGSKEGMRHPRGTGVRKPRKKTTIGKQTTRGKEQPALEQKRRKENIRRKAKSN